jgi:hypothetical protein
VLKELLRLYTLIKGPEIDVEVSQHGFHFVTVSLPKLFEPPSESGLRG